MYYSATGPVRTISGVAHLGDYRIGLNLRWVPALKNTGMAGVASDIMPVAVSIGSGRAEWRKKLNIVDRVNYRFCCIAVSKVLAVALTLMLVGCNTSMQKPPSSSSGQSSSSSSSSSGSSSSSSAGGGQQSSGQQGSGEQGAGQQGSGQQGAGSAGSGQAGSAEAGTAGAAGQSGQSGGAAGSGETGIPQSSGSNTGGTGSGNQGDLEGVFDESLGDFDQEMGREASDIASSGQGSTQSAQQRESGDAGAVRDSARGQSGMSQSGGGAAAAGGVASASGAGSMSGSSGSGQGEAGAQSSEDAGEGQDGVTSGLGGGDVDAAEQEAAKAARIPEDIPMDGSAEDQVARQIREAAMAETDPAIRDALWDEYRKHTGLK